MTPNRRIPQPSDAAILERAVSLASEAMRGLELQKGRVRPKEPEDDEFASRWWVNLQFFIVTLRRLRRVADLAKKVPSVSQEIGAAITEFDNALPMLLKMRDVGEHIDEYALDRGRHKDVARGMLQVGEWDGETYKWLEESLSITDSHNVAGQLYSVIRKGLKDCRKPDMSRFS